MLKLVSSIASGNKKLPREAKIHPQWGYSGINVTGGPTEPNILHPKKYMDLILCTQKNTRLETVFESCFRILRELWLELRKNY